MREQLDPTRLDEQWQRAITAIERRFAARFIEPADALRKLDAADQGAFPEGRGFAILALDCLLIETLFGYRRGRRTLFGETSDAFKAFLAGAPSFKDDAALRARIPSFATAVRNGVLHDGETREGWIVWKSGPPGILAEVLGDRRLVLYRDAFHSAVVAAQKEYFDALRAGAGTEEAELRARFRDRVDQLCDESSPP